MPATIIETNPAPFARLAIDPVTLDIIENALRFYRTRSFYKLDAAIFLAKKVVSESELLPPRPIRRRGARAVEPPEG